MSRTLPLWLLRVACVTCQTLQDVDVLDVSRITRNALGRRARLGFLPIASRRLYVCLSMVKALELFHKIFGLIYKLS
jgi:hypothetical protein